MELIGASLSHRPTQDDRSIVWFPVDAKLDIIVACWIEPFRYFDGVRDKWGKQKKLCVPALSVDCCKKEF